MTPLIGAERKKGLNMFQKGKTVIPFKNSNTVPRTTDCVCTYKPFIISTRELSQITFAFFDIF